MGVLIDNTNNLIGFSDIIKKMNEHAHKQLSKNTYVLTTMRSIIYVMCLNILIIHQKGKLEDEIGNTIYFIRTTVYSWLLSLHLSLL